MQQVLGSKCSIRAQPLAASRSTQVCARRALVIRSAKGGEEGGATFDNSVYGTVAKNANYMILGTLIAKTGLDKTLMDANSKFTLFAPDDDAFSAAARKLGVTKLELQNLPNLEEIIKSHVCSGEVTTSTFTEGGDITTMGGKAWKASTAGPKVNGVTLKKKDLKASNGIIHAIGEVLL